MGYVLIDDILDEEKEGFKIESLDSANWAFRKLRAIEEKEKEAKDLAEKEIQRYTNWLEKELERYSKDKQYFNYLLQEYFRSEKAKDSRFRLSTPYGKVTARKSKKWVYEDEVRLMEYLKQSEPNCVRVKEEINKSEVKKLFKDGINSETGEILPFVRIEEEETISIKVD